jgi:coatomer subunit delta
MCISQSISCICCSSQTNRLILWKIWRHYDCLSNWYVSNICVSPSLPPLPPLLFIYLPLLYHSLLFVCLFVCVWLCTPPPALPPTSPTQIPEYCQGNTEKAVMGHAFDLIMAIDEVISVGYKENVTLSQVKTFTEMDSHEEKLQKIILESKMNDAREAARRKADSIDKQNKLNRKKMQGMGSSTAGPHGGMGSSMGDNFSSSSSSSNSYSSSRSDEKSARTSSQKSTRKKKTASKPRSSGISGMQLSKAKKGQDEFVSALTREEKIPAHLANQRASALGGINATAQEVVAHQSVHVDVVESLSLSMERDGALKKLEVKGEVVLTVNDPDDTRIVIHTGAALQKSDGFQHRLHPKCDKNAYSADGALTLKDSSKGFPVGSDSAATLLRWRRVSTDEDEIPFSINFWPNTEDDMCVVSVEINIVNEAIACENVVISIPCPSDEPPEVQDECTGEWAFNRSAQCIQWRIPEISAAQDSAVLEFEVADVDPEDFYPLSVTFSSSTLYSNLEVTQVTAVEDDTDKEFTQTAKLEVSKFIVE